jgi:hypothetical protein
MKEDFEKNYDDLKNNYLIDKHMLIYFNFISLYKINLNKKNFLTIRQYFI